MQLLVMQYFEERKAQIQRPRKNGPTRSSTATIKQQLEAWHAKFTAQSLST
jgi:hypothetical protein